MDQVRAIAKVLWQQRFWVLSALGTLVAVTCWYLAAGDLESRFSSRKSAINGQFSALEALRREAFHPNEEVIQGNLKQTVDQRESVYQVWSDLYEHQRTEVLYWPKDNVLGDEFIDHMEGRKFRDKISSDMRGLYRNYIQNRFEALLEIVQARKTTGKGGRSRPGGSRFGGMGGEFGGEFGGGLGGGFPGGRRRSTSGEEEEDDYLVEWLDQGALQSRLSFAKMPTHDQVWITQEDLWVYETLLHVIAKTNKQRGATRPDNTAVREIVTLQVGRPAIGSSQRQGKIYMPPAEGAAGSSGMGLGGGGMGMMGGEGGMMGGEMGMGYGGGEMGMGPRGGDGGMGYGGGMGGGMGGPRGEGSDVLANRYLDPTGQPISGENLSAEFRQLPVHMILMMDQRWLPQVLLECANAPLPVEVKWLRINPEKSRSTGGRASSGGRRRSSGQQGQLEDPNFATVEIQGVVLIYGEPNKEILNVPGAEEGSREEDNRAEDSNELAGT